VLSGLVVVEKSEVWRAEQSTVKSKTRLQWWRRSSSVQ